MDARERIDVLLVLKGIFPTRTRAQSEIISGNVLVNDTEISKPGTMVKLDSAIRLRDTFPYVSRGALKLIHALDSFHCEVGGHTAIDIGSSTGGFTQVLLERGASHVYSVDCGTNQLDWKLRSDPRVHVMENTNARDLVPSSLDPAPDFAVIDISFISLTKVLVPLCGVLKTPFTIIALIKPQFELEKAKIGRRGLVDENYRNEAITRVLDFAKSLPLKASEVITSPIKGAKSGNVEYLVKFDR